MERVGWSGDVFASATREALRAAELEVAAARLAERRDRISKLGVRRAAPPAMPREAWSGSPFSSPARVTRTRRTLADSHDSASVDDIPEIDTLDAVSASPQYSSRLGRQASVVEGDDGDSFEESD